MSCIAYHHTYLLTFYTSNQVLYPHYSSLEPRGRLTTGTSFSCASIYYHYSWKVIKQTTLTTVEVMNAVKRQSPLHWRHNDHDGVSNHQPHGCLLNRLFRRRSKKTSKLRVTGLCVGNSPRPVNSPHNGPVTRKMFPFDDVIMSKQRTKLESWWIPCLQQRHGKIPYIWWRHQMETFSALLALYAGNSSVPANSPHKGQWRGALMFSLICAWSNSWANNGDTGDLRRHRAHYDVILMQAAFNTSISPRSSSQLIGNNTYLLSFVFAGAIMSSTAIECIADFSECFLNSKLPWKLKFSYHTTTKKMSLAFLTLWRMSEKVLVKHRFFSIKRKRLSICEGISLIVSLSCKLCNNWVCSNIIEIQRNIFEKQCNHWNPQKGCFTLPCKSKWKYLLVKIRIREICLRKIRTVVFAMRLLLLAKQGGGGGGGVVWTNILPA